MPVNPDLLRERKKCTFNPIEITHFIDGDSQKTADRRELTDFFLSDGTFDDKVPSDYLSHAERYELAVKKSCLLLKKIEAWQEKSSTIGVDIFEKLLGGMLGGACLPDGQPLGLHYIMFIPAILGQGTVEQQALWISRAWSNEIIGTYAQTELGHGTFIRGLETTAHYDEKNEEFIINSPTLTSYKWWPGGLGHTANYAIVMAQLYTKGEWRGIHPFIVQLRDEDTHMPMPGIDVGDIGSKFGMNATNNGFLGFKKVRIPRMNMLMKNAKVLKDGTFVKGLNEKLTYGTMIFVRVTLVKGVAMTYLSKAVTIATRYSVVRRQCTLDSVSEKEAQIIDYMTQQYKIFPHIATVFSIMFASRWLYDMYHKVTEDLDSGELEHLPELHAMSCCLKAVCTFDAAQGIEECRKSCGGHGYMVSSGFPLTYSSATAAETYEGENTVLHLQTARFLIKTYHLAKAGEMMNETCKYMEKGYSLHQGRVWRNSMENIIEAFECVAAGLIRDSADRVYRLVSVGKTEEAAWNQTSNLLVKASEAHCRAFMVKRFYKGILDASVSSAVTSVLIKLCELYGVYFLLKNLGYFLMYSDVRVADVDSIQEWQDMLLTDIRPNAVGLVDSLDIPDKVLCSSLGAYDGDVYNRIFEEAKKNPLNDQPVNSSFHKYLKPMLNSKF